MQTDELNGSCSAGRGWRKNPMTQPERGLHPERTLSAEPDPERRHSMSRTDLVHLSMCSVAVMGSSFSSVGMRRYLIGEENIN